MKKLTFLLFAIGGLALGNLSGCVAYDAPYRDGAEYRGDRDHDRYRDRDRDGDGVRNRQDRRPDDPTRY